jgi:NAD(P)-dependent dehydrogenase (short-subunit alcohol dehydrogenase family)
VSFPHAADITQPAELFSAGKIPCIIVFLMTDTARLPHDWEPAADMLADRIILITGAADGIGRGLARSCAKYGATVVMLDRNVRGLEQVYDEILAAGHPEPALYPLDLQGATPDDYATLAQTIEREFRHLHGLVHNAALLGALIPLAHFDDELWYQVMQINLNAPYLLTRACLDLMTRSGDDASIVFTSDAAGRRGKAYWGAYGVAKAGLENLMQILADELEANTPVRANSIDPGAVRTALRLIAYPGEDRSRLRAADEVLRPFLYLLSIDSRRVSGQQFSVD